ncbi:MAG: hypothetical protein KC503_44060 [Myxococcales bacterium]|nr:hypothetical protein [Myxococcales bacterium]
MTMPHMIEPAKSGRAACRKCKKKIEKGQLRFGLAMENAFSDSGEPSYRWFHLECASQTKPVELGQAISSYDGELPDKDKLEQAIAANKKKVKPSSYPYGERSPSGRAACIHCDEKIAKGDLRIAVEREIDTGAFTTSGAGYLHVGCAAEYADDDELLEKIKTNSTSLEAADLAELESKL